MTKKSSDKLIGEIVKQANEIGYADFKFGGYNYSLRPEYLPIKLQKIENDKIAKSHKEASELDFKKECRRTAVQLASRSFGGNDLTQEADKIYQWLIKVLK